MKWDHTSHRTFVSDTFTLDTSNLENAKPGSGHTDYRCPACAEEGSDTNGDNLRVFDSGAFVCIKYQEDGDDKIEHNRRIFKLCGRVPAGAKPATPPEKPVRIFSTLEDAVGLPKHLYLYPKNGKEFAAVGRFHKCDGTKAFVQVRRVEKGWQRKAPLELMPLYQQEAITPTGILYVVEGEKCQEAATSIGLNATTSAGGASAPEKTDWTPLAGREVCILPDNDEAGREYAKKVTDLLHNLTPPAVVKVVNLPTDIKGGDIADLVSNCKSAEDRESMVKEIAELEAKAVPVQASEPIQPPSEDGFDTFTFSDLRSYTVDQSSHIIGEGWIRRKCMCLITAGTGLGKSVLVEQLACCVASGVSFMTMTVSRPYRVLLVEAENDAENLQRDILSIVKNVTPKICPVLVEANLKIANVYGSNPDELSKWLSNKIDAFKPDLIIIDPYQSYIGEAELNSSEAFSGFVRRVDPIIRKANCAWVLVDHTPKPRDRKEWTSRESVYMAAGHSNKSNFARTSCELYQADDEGLFKLLFSKNRERTGLTDCDGKLLKFLFVEHSKNRHEPWWKISDLQARPVVKPKSKHFDLITQFDLKNPGLSIREISTKTGIPKSSVYEILGNRTLNENKPVQKLSFVRPVPIGTPDSRTVQGTLSDGQHSGQSRTVPDSCSEEAIPPEKVAIEVKNAVPFETDEDDEFAGLGDELANQKPAPK